MTIDISPSYQYAAPVASPEPAASAPQVYDFIQQFNMLSQNVQIDIFKILGSNFLSELGTNQPLSIFSEHFFSVCYILAQQPHPSALNAWVSVPRGQTKTSVDFTGDETIDVSISHSIGKMVYSIKARIKEEGQYFEPRPRLWEFDGAAQMRLLADPQLDSLFQEAQPFSQESALTDYGLSQGSQSFFDFASPLVSPSNSFTTLTASQVGRGVGAGHALQRSPSVETTLADDLQAEGGSSVHDGGLSRTSTAVSDDSIAAAFAPTRDVGRRVRGIPTPERVPICGPYTNVELELGNVPFTSEFEGECAIKMSG